jgi:hypothetical protein
MASTPAATASPSPPSARQRLLGVFPNFYSSYIWGRAIQHPAEVRPREHSLFDPAAFAATAITGIEQERNDFPGYGSGASGRSPTTTT